ncbi:MULTISPECIES: helix-turn-helix domain-containing protein [Lentzea]|uniref:DNA-binding transcriptional regulator, XRE-family HTH domain n=2 Tax=Lentzea TaxID=165301 RepID=A0A1W2DCI5_9PSEU|nr:MULTISPECIES: helix-turn-helix domain-containing protein [Lentzea]MDX8140518.1 helix-turn-helix domain-containing protein [Lentzea sp. BCCO 10_0061]SMC95083.1 DNA-binding transcriptional regulator, XRE-family HTH domain [Lentzea albidocapillata]
MATPRTELAALRGALGLSQEDLARLVGVSVGTIGRWERGQTAKLTPTLQPLLAKALRLKTVGELLRVLHPHGPSSVPNTSGAKEAAGMASSSQGMSVRGSDDLDRVHAVVPRLRRVLDAFDLPEDGPARPLEEIAADVTRINEHRLEARYGVLADQLPGLLAELARASQVVKSDEQLHQAAALRTLVFRAADGIAFKFGYLDLSARLIDLMRQSAAAANDRLLVAASEYVRTETFFANGDLATGARALVAAADAVALSNRDRPDVAAAYGSLHMRAAVVAGRRGDGRAATDHLREARHAADKVREGIYRGTAFGPHSIRIHELAVAAELRDPVGVGRASAWHPPSELPAERRSHYYIDLGRAQLNLGRHDDAYACIERAREAAPQHTREHPQVKCTLGTLLQRRPGNSRVVELAAWAGARAI